VRQVTQRNPGRKTAAIDGEIVLTAQARADLVVLVHSTTATWQPPAVKRVYTGQHDHGMWAKSSLG
jgi:RNA-directed DNA polymerase